MHRSLLFVITAFFIYGAEHVVSISSSSKDAIQCQDDHNQQVVCKVCEQDQNQNEIVRMPKQLQWLRAKCCAGLCTETEMNQFCSSAHYPNQMTSKLSSPIFGSSNHRAQKRSAAPESPRALHYRNYLRKRQDQEEEIRKILQNFGYFEFPTFLHRMGEPIEVIGLKTVVEAANAKQQDWATPSVLPSIVKVQQKGSSRIKQAGVKQPESEAHQEHSEGQERRTSTEKPPVQVQLRPLDSLSPQIIWSPTKTNERSGQLSSSRTQQLSSDKYHRQSSTSPHSKSKHLNDLSILDFSMGSTG